MKLRISFFILAIIFISCSANAQIRIGVLASANNTSFSGDTPPDASYVSHVGYGFGATVDYYFSQDIVLNIQPMYTDKSTILQFDVNYQYEKFDSIKVNIQYFEIPINVKVIADNQITYVTAGVNISYPINATKKDLRTEEVSDLKTDLNKLSVGANFGVGIQFHIGAPLMFIEARYSQSLTNLTEGELSEDIIDAKIKSNSWFLFAGLLFTL